MQEQAQRPSGPHKHSCCLSIPRTISLNPDGLLLQAPLPELAGLRSKAKAWHLLDTSYGSSGAGATIAGGYGQGSWMEAGQQLLQGLDGADVGSSAAAAAAGAGVVAHNGSGEGVVLLPGAPVHAGWTGVAASGQLDVEVVITRGDSKGFAVLIPPQGMSGDGGVAVAFDWVTRVLQVVHSVDWQQVEVAAAAPLPPRTHHLLAPTETAAVERDVAAAVDAVELDGSRSSNSGDLLEKQQQEKEGEMGEQELPRRVGGEVRLLGGLVVDDGHLSAQTLSLRLLVDGSLLEVFTDGGEALATRVYRNSSSSTTAAEPCSSSSGSTKLQVGAFGGAAQLRSCSIWEMESCWVEDQQTAEPIGLPILVDLPDTASAAVACEAAVAAAAATATGAVAAAATAASAWQVQPLVLDGLVEGVMEGCVGLPSPWSPAAEMHCA